MEHGYWGIMGLAHPIRCMLAASNQNWTDKIYTLENKDDWFATDKPAMKENTNFPNLPYLKDGDLVVTQSAAIMRYLGEKYGWWGADIKSRTQSEILHGVLYDLWKKFYTLQTSGEDNYSKNKSQVNSEILESLKPVCEQIKQHAFLAGQELTWVDFYGLYLFYILSLWSKDVKNMSEISAFIEKVLATLSGKSDKFRKSWDDWNENMQLIVEPYWQWGAKAPAKLEHDV